MYVCCSGTSLLPPGPVGSIHLERDRGATAVERKSVYCALAAHMGRGLCLHQKDPSQDEICVLQRINIKQL